MCKLGTIFGFSSFRAIKLEDHAYQQVGRFVHQGKCTHPLLIVHANLKIMMHKQRCKVPENTDGPTSPREHDSEIREMTPINVGSGLTDR